ncbi:helix-turn-helix domain-containing protein [Clostridiaceae bacterium M8S5]|nr:helix-turn-helix domain-containing protein [Clostridiaceae bacterium M8S5]
MDYIDLINKTVEYIENNLEEEINLNKLSKRFYMSKYYFHRIFTAVIGCSLSKYIKQRRLNRALEYILETNDKIVDITYKLLFTSQASFARAFKTQYGLAPIEVRKTKNQLSVIPVPNILVRTMKNFNSDIVIDFTFIEKEISLTGFYIDVDLTDKDIQQKVNERAQKFTSGLKEQKFDAFAIYFKGGKGSNKFIHTFLGVDLMFDTEKTKWETYKIPKKLYAKFKYSGDLLHIGDIVVKDLYRWLNISKIEIEESDIAFIQKYDEFYKENKISNIYLPIKDIPQNM